MVLSKKAINKLPGWLDQIQVLVWDLDGTLYQEIPELRKEIQSHTVDLIRQVKKVSKREAERIFSQMYQKLGSSTQTLIDCGVDRLYALSGEWYAEIQLRYLRRDQDLQTMFERLQNKRHILNTNSINFAAQKKLKRLGLNDRIFEKLFTNADMFGVLKPDPKPFLAVLEYTKLPAAVHLFIGDREKTDLEPAKALGMRTCLVWGESTLADISLSTVYEVAQLFDQMINQNVVG